MEQYYVLYGIFAETIRIVLKDMDFIRNHYWYV